MKRGQIFRGLVLFVTVVTLTGCDDLLKTVSELGVKERVKPAVSTSWDKEMTSNKPQSIEMNWFLAEVSK